MLLSTMIVVLYICMYKNRKPQVFFNMTVPLIIFESGFPLLFLLAENILDFEQAKLC